MKGLGKILARYVLSAAGIALALIFLNVAVFILYTIQSLDTEPVYKRRLGELADSVQRSGSGWQAAGGSVLEGDYCWAMLLDENGDILWSEALPEEQNRHYTVSDVASFTRWYLSDYPVQVWKHEAGLFVIAKPRGSMWKQQMDMSEYAVKRLLNYTVPAFLILNITAALVMAMAFGLRLFHSVKPVAQGIADLAEQRPVELEEKGMLKDLSAGLNRASQQLCWQEMLLKKRDRTRTEWIAGVSHDIRTPLTLVLGEAAQLEEDINPEIRAKARTIRIQGERIRTLVSDLNLASKLAYELQPLQKQKFRPAELLREVAAEMLNSGMDEGFSLEMQIPAECEGIVLEGDARLLERAVRNLVGNSIRHNPQGCAIRIGMQGTAAYCSFLVEDTGVGFPPTVLERLRRPQEEAISSHGLGLNIVRQVMAAHGGTARFENTQTGSLSVLALPLKGAGQEPHKPSST